MTFDPRKLDAILARHAMVSDRLNSGPDAESFVALSRELSDLDPVVAAIQSVRTIEKDIADLTELITDPTIDAEMRGLADEERRDALVRQSAAERELRLMLLPKDAADERGAILEVRAGTGGDEAALFAGDLFRMYQRYAESRRWTVEVLSASEGTMGGFKEIIAELRGIGVFGRLKFESGVHRVQRVPQTETSGRIHTSAITVAVLPEPDEVDVQIEPGEMLITAGAASTDAYLITAGSAEVTGSSVKGRGGRAVQFGPGDVVGELGLLLDRPRNATVRATTPLECLALGRGDLKAAVETSPELGWSLLQTVAERLDG